MLDAYPRVYFACHTRHVPTRQTAPVSAHQASILDHLDEVDAMSMTDLAGHMGVTVATMSLAIDRLERRAYVRRDRDPRDRRRVLLRVTPAGVRLREAKSVLDPVRVEQVLAHLSPADRDAALRGLDLLARASERHMRAKRPGVDRVSDRCSTWGPPLGGPTANAIVYVGPAEAGPHVRRFAALRSYMDMERALVASRRSAMRWDRNCRRWAGMLVAGVAAIGSMLPRTTRRAARCASPARRLTCGP